MSDEGMRMRSKVFVCPLCGQLTRVITPKDFIYLERVTCEGCKKDFLIEDNRTKTVN